MEKIIDIGDRFTTDKTSVLDDVIVVEIIEEGARLKNKHDRLFIVPIDALIEALKEGHVILIKNKANNTHNLYNKLIL